MKQLIFIVIIMMGMGNSYAMRKQGQQLAIAMSDLNIGSAQHGDEKPVLQQSEDKKSWTQRLLQNNNSDTQKYLDFRNFYIALIEADAETVKTMLEQIRSTYHLGHATYFLIQKDYHDLLVRDFKKELGAMLREQWPFPKAWPWPLPVLWLALEMVIYGEKHHEPEENQERYQRRLSILKQLLVVLPDRNNDKSLVLRNQFPPSSFACWFSWLCVPCVCYACVEIGSGLQHRAAQANSLEAFKILIMKRDYDFDARTWGPVFKEYRRDSEGWGPVEYAIYFGAEDVLAYLKGEKGLRYGCCESCEPMESSPCLACFTCNKEVREMVYSEGYCCLLNKK